MENSERLWKVTEFQKPDEEITNPDPVYCARGATFAKIRSISGDMLLPKYCEKNGSQSIELLFRLNKCQLPIGDSGETTNPRPSDSRICDLAFFLSSPFERQPLRLLSHNFVRSFCLAKSWSCIILKIYFKYLSFSVIFF